MNFHSNKIYERAFEIFPTFDLLNKPNDIISFEEWLLKNCYFGSYNISLKIELLKEYEEQHLDYFAFKLISDPAGYRFCLFNYITNKVDEIKKQYCYEQYSNKFYFLKSRGFNDNTVDYLMRQLPEEVSAFSVSDLYTSNSDFGIYIYECENCFDELKNNSFLAKKDALIEDIYLSNYQILNKLRLQIIAKVNRNGAPLPKKPESEVKHLSEEELKFRREHVPEPEDILRSVNRSKRMVKDLIRCGNMDQMLTLTYRNLVLDRKEVYNHLKKFFDYLRRGFSIKIKGLFKKILPVRFCYVATLEKHKSGGYHVHMAIKGKFNYTYVRWAWQKAVGGNGDELLSDSLGYCKFTKWENRYTKTSGNSWNSRKLASYLSKYMVEDFLKNYVKGQKRYFRSEFIDKPKENYIWLNSKCFDDSCFEFTNKTYELANFVENKQYVWLSPDQTTFLITGEVI